MSREREIGRFFAKTDNGKEYQIVEYQKYIDASTMDSPNEEIPGIKRMQTTDGLHVNYIDSETFKIVETNEIVRKV